MRYKQALISILEDIQPQSVLVLDASGENPVADFFAQHPDCQTTFLSKPDFEEQLQALNKHDIAIITNTLETLSYKQGSHIISRLRDFYGCRLLISLPHVTKPEDTIWSETDMLSFGMSSIKLEDSTEEKPELWFKLYEYNIYNYKNIPDWLNNKHWANPELWNKYRW